MGGCGCGCGSGVMVQMGGFMGAAEQVLAFDAKVELRARFLDAILALFYSYKKWGDLHPILAADAARAEAPRGTQKKGGKPSNTPLVS